MTFSIIDIFTFIISRWWKMLVALGVFMVLGVVLAFALPKRYKSEVKILPTAQESGLSSVLSGIQSQLGLSGLTIPGSDAGSLVQVYKDILISKTVQDYVIDTCRLLKRMKLKNRQEAYSELDGMTGFSLTPEFVFVISIMGNDNVVVADIANAYATALDNYLKHSSNTRGRHMREFVESRLAEVKTDLEEAQDSLIDFQKKNALPMISPEAGADIQAFSELKAQAFAKELELDYMRTFSTTDNPQYEAARKELYVLNSKLASLPPIASRYIELYRNFEVQQQLYLLLMQQYEQAKLMEAKDTPLISILEKASPEEKPIFPQKSLVVAALLVIGLVLIVLYALIRVYWANVTSHPESHDKMTRLRSEIKETFGRRRR